jgi:hypothetical protein
VTLSIGVADCAWIMQTIRTFRGPYIGVSAGSIAVQGGHVGATASASPQVNVVEAKASAAGPAPVRSVPTPAKAVAAPAAPAAAGGAGKFCR